MSPTPQERLVALFLVVGGIVFALAGGGCTLLLLLEMARPRGGVFGVGGFMVLLALFVLAFGAAAAWAGLRLMRGR